MTLFAFRKQLDVVLDPMIAQIARLPIRANQWTALGALLGIAAGWALWRGLWWVGLALVLLRGLIDLIDGYVARNYNQGSIFGAVMDDVCDRWVLGIMYAGACLQVGQFYPQALLLLGVGITGALTNVIIKISIYAEAQHDITRATGKLGHPIDNVGAFGSAEFIVYFGVGILITAITRDVRPALVGLWAVAVMSHVSLLQRIVFAWKRYRFVNANAVASTTSTTLTSSTTDETKLDRPA